MSVQAATPVLMGNAARRALVQLDARLLLRGALIITVLTAALTAIVVLQYAVMFASPADAHSLEMLAQNPAIRVLFGVPRALDDAGGFTVWRTGTIAAVTAAAWALAAATRLTRGEEDTGRVWLTLAGSLRLSSALLLHVLVLAALLVVLGSATALAMVGAGAGAGGAAVYAAGLAAIGMLFAATGAACGQLLGKQRAASGLAAGLLLVGLLVRMVADGIDTVAWASWLTPFGLLALSRPYAGDHWLPIALLIGEAGAIAGLAWVAAGRRDVGTGMIGVRGGRAPRLRLLRSAAGFATRRLLPALTGWSLALCGYFMLIGLLAVSLTDFLEQNPRFADLAAQAGFARLATVQGYAASLLALLPIALGLFVASRVAGVAADEKGGRLALVMSRPVGRLRWLGAETGVLFVACMLAGVVAATSLCIGANVVGAALLPAEALASVLNVVPVALLSLGAALFAFGWRPQSVMLIGAAPTVGGFVWWVLADTLEAPDRVRQISPFAHLAPVPAEPPDWPGAIAMLGLSAVLATMGLIGFRRRDILH